MLEQKVSAFLQRKQFHLENKGIVVGVSGGPDSLALLHLLWSMREKQNIQITAAHLDHMFRGVESEQEALFVKAFCEERQIPFEMKQVNVPQFMKESGLSAEVAGRECRYAFFKEVLTKHNMSFLALGHHGDDQIETILMRLTRGSAGKARAGIPFTRHFHNGLIVRPLLSVSKAEIEQYCSTHQLNPRRDATNELDIYSRNRFRKTLLPFLKNENPHVHEHFQRFSEELQEDEAYLQEITAEKMRLVIKKKTSDHVTIDIDSFLAMPMPLQRRGIQLILNYLYRVRPASLSALHIEQIFFILKSPHPSSTLDFPEGLKVFRSYKECHFQFLTESLVTPFMIELFEPTEVVLPNGDKLIMEFIDQERCDVDHPYSYCFQLDERNLPLIIRNRRNGDRMTIKGMTGTKKIKNLFIDEKVPLHKRNSWPIITTCRDQILWVPGLRKANVPAISNTHDMRTIFLTYIKQ